MIEYDIKRWDVILKDNNTRKIPVIYIKPDDAFLTFAKKNNYVVSSHINNTDTIYDGKHIAGTVDKSCCLHGKNSRPEFFKQTGYYVIILYDAFWYGYPNNENMGTVSFIGIEESAREPVADKLSTVSSSSSSGGGSGNNGNNGFSFVRLGRL